MIPFIVARRQMAAAYEIRTTELMDIPPLVKETRLLLLLSLLSSNQKRKKCTCILPLNIYMFFPAFFPNRVILRPTILYQAMTILKVLFKSFELS